VGNGSHGARVRRRVEDVAAAPEGARKPLHTAGKRISGGGPSEHGIKKGEEPNVAALEPKLKYLGNAVGRKKQYAVMIQKTDGRGRDC